MKSNKEIKENLLGKDSAKLILKILILITSLGALGSFIVWDLGILSITSSLNVVWLLILRFIEVSK